MEAVEDEDGFTPEFIDEVADEVRGWCILSYFISSSVVLQLDRSREDSRGEETNGLKGAISDWPGF